MLAAVLLAIPCTGRGRLAAAQQQPATLSLLPNLGALVVDARTGHAFAIAYSTQPGSDGQVAMFNAATGALLHITPVQVYSVNALAVDEQTGHLFVTQVDAHGRARVAMLDTRDAALVHSAPVGQEPEAMAVDVRAGRVYVMSAPDSTITALDARTGRVQRTMPAGTSPAALAVDERNGHVFSAGIMQRLTMLDGATGQVLRVVAIPPWPMAVGVDEQAGRVFVVSLGTLLPRGATPDPGIAAIVDATTGSIRGAVRVGKGPRSLVVDEQTGRAFVLNVTVGYVAGAFPRLPGPIGSSVSVLDTRTGAVLRTVALSGSATSLALDQLHGRVFVLNLGTAIPPKICTHGCRWHFAGNSSITALDAHNGSILHTFPIGGMLGAMAVDERHSLLLVTRDNRRVIVLDTHHL